MNQASHNTYYTPNPSLLISSGIGSILIAAILLIFGLNYSNQDGFIDPALIEAVAVFLGIFGVGVGILQIGVGLVRKKIFSFEDQQE